MEVIIEKLDHFGRGIAKKEGKVCFVENALPGEIVKIKIIRDSRKHMEAEVVSYLKTSSDRIQEKCPYTSFCGGCSCPHLSFEKENEWKEKKVKEAIHKFAGLDENLVFPIVYRNEFYYRNKIILHGKDGKLGFYQKNTNHRIPIQECLLANHKINEIIPLLQNQKIEEAIIKTSNHEDKVMLSIKGKVENIENLLHECDVLKVNQDYITEKRYIKTMVGDKEYQESISSFFQVNEELTKELYEEVKKVVKEKRPRVLLDLYCGTGSIGLYCREYCQKLIGIDSNRYNIEDAKMNQKEDQNSYFILDTVENQVDLLKESDLIIVDPPRSGLDEKTREHLSRWKGNTLIYVSCDPITLARDLNELKENYNVRYIKPFNMFPRTHHVECISVLERKNVEK